MKVHNYHELMKPFDAQRQPPHPPHTHTYARNADTFCSAVNFRRDFALRCRLQIDRNRLGGYAAPGRGAGRCRDRQI